MAGFPGFPYPGFAASGPLKRPHFLCTEEMEEFNIFKNSVIRERPSEGMPSSEEKGNARESGWFGERLIVDGGYEGVSGHVDHNISNTSNDGGNAQNKKKQPPQRTGLTLETAVWSDYQTFERFMPVYGLSNAGVTPEFPCNDSSKEVDYFLAFFDEEMAKFVCEQSNRYQEFFISTANTPKPSKMRKWRPMDVPEFYIFSGLLLLMAHVKKHVLKEYWITNDLVSTPAFGKYMARDRFVEMLRYLHFADNRFPVESDKLWKVRPIHDKLREKFIRYFRPFQNVCVEESLVLFRGRVVFRQYIPAKRHCFGTKFFVVCDYDSGYVLDLVVYSGTDVEIDSSDPIAVSGAIVQDLMNRYFGGSHILYTDSYNTPPGLHKYLVEPYSGSNDATKAHDKHWPKFNDKQPKSTLQFERSAKMLAIRWHDNRPANLQNTPHLTETLKQQSGPSDKGKKHDTMSDFSLNMKLAYESAMQVGDVECVRKCLKWHKKIFLHLIDITMLNAYNLFLVNTGKRPSLRAFSKQVIEQLLQKYHTPLPSVPRRRVENKPSRLQGKDYISKHHITPNPNKQRRRCYVCYHTKRRKTLEKRSSFQCNDCKVALCVTPCFMEYHTLTEL